MIKYKVFVPDTSGKITFTKIELENLLNEVYHEGYTDRQMSNMVNIKYGDTPIWRYNTITCDTAQTGQPSLEKNITFNNTTTTTIGD